MKGVIYILVERCKGNQPEIFDTTYVRRNAIKSLRQRYSDVDDKIAYTEKNENDYLHEFDTSGEDIQIFYKDKNYWHGCIITKNL